LRVARRLLAREGKYMETVSSIVKKEGEHQFLSFSIDGEELKIPLTDDNPQAVKEVFNKLIVRLKKGIFKIEMTEAGKDLFSQVTETSLIII
jgi:hypothetical protein